MRLRFWAVVTWAVGWLDHYVDRDWTWDLWRWAVERERIAYHAQREVGT